MNQTFKLICRTCDYERTVSGLDPALDLAGSHKDDEGEDHSVDIYSFAYLASGVDRDRLPSAPWLDDTDPRSADPSAVGDDGLADTDD
ncbi:hypothetical protein ACFPYI_11165 [Halomarina salina]|uniref:Uncharacterized protein n=1 Tax=Halomarina salina TaxID=1872699 RepID=A0ABD5RMM4_9EURY|nr:hypothetical protein [Halomarina salina]